MKVYKSPTADFTSVSNAILKCHPSLKAIGLYFYIVQKPDDWNFSIGGTARQLQDGKESIQSAIRELEEIGFLTRKQNRNEDGTLGESVWEIRAIPSKNSGLTDDGKAADGLTGTGCISAIVNTNEVNTKRVTTNQERGEISFLPAYIDCFNSLFGSHHKPTKGREEKLAARLKKFTREEILRALSNLSKSPFHRGDNDRKWVADPDFLIRNDEQVDKWINKAPPKQQTLGEMMGAMPFEEMKEKGLLW